VDGEKYKFLLPKVIFLGDVINREGIKPDPDRLRAMLEFPVPTCQNKLKGALAMFQFYKKYIPNYSIIVAIIIIIITEHLILRPKMQANSKAHAFLLPIILALK